MKELFQKFLIIISKNPFPLPKLLYFEILLGKFLFFSHAKPRLFALYPVSILPFVFPADP